jgi:hypothetical protein
MMYAASYSETLGLRSEVPVGAAVGFPQDSAIRCDFLTLMMKAKRTYFVGTLSPDKQRELNRAPSYAFQLAN